MGAPNLPPQLPATPAAAGVAAAIAAVGWHPRARRVVSPNRDARPAGIAVELLVLHNISLPPGRFGGPGVEQLFTNRLDPAADPFYTEIAGLKVSAHFFLRRDGSLIQFVSCGERAWHAGVSRWRGREKCNDFSIGIEIEGTDERPYTARQYARLAGLIDALRAAYPGIAGIAAHSEIAPGRKTDPGPSFDWARLVAACKLPRAWRRI
ncbi:MAG: N-acetylmuramyl-L-alanine amidase, negative regulator of AmpC, AmpD [Betaproteobacteria bacterium]|nr:N-acetylmuramyl-L-alanine amidase, negative regulator of AmpC, AmpD [Betaproteobacteria bacterium]